MIMILKAVAAGLLFCGGSARAAENGKTSYDMFEYSPWPPGMVWTYANRELFPGRTLVSVKGTVQAKDGDLKVVDWGDGWVDFYAESEKGLERVRDINERTGGYGVYLPAAVQYPRRIKAGETYTRKALRLDYSRGGVLVSSGTETLDFTVTGVEDVSVPSGEYKQCLKTVADTRLEDMSGRETFRRISVSWRAKGVGLVKGLLIEMNDGKITRSKYGGLESVKNDKRPPNS